MSDQDIEKPTASEVDSEAPDHSTQTDARAEPARPEAGTARGAREDDRNEEVEESPVPDPEPKESEPTASDDPQAD
jgi:hypothetical protein